MGQPTRNIHPYHDQYWMGNCFPLLQLVQCDNDAYCDGKPPGFNSNKKQRLGWAVILEPSAFYLHWILEHADAHFLRPVEWLMEMEILQCIIMFW